MDLLLGNKEVRHVSHDTVAEFENSVLLDPRVRAVRPVVPSLPTVGLNLFTMVKRIDSLTNWRMKATIPVDSHQKHSRDYFAVLMGADIMKCLPHFMLPARKSIYLFDAWPNRAEEIREFVEHYDVNYVFVTSLQAAEKMNTAIQGCSVRWIPEGVDPSLYSYRPFAERNIDVLQIGRKFDAYHELIVEPLAQLRKVYLYERTRGELVFPTRAEFVDGLARAKISICVPSSITHPDRSGEIETMTTRYLQSMVSQCLILGHAPSEMVRLFGYNPVVEIDMKNPVEQIDSLLDHYSDYEPLLQRNYEAVISQHTWSHRWRTIARVLWPQAQSSDRMGSDPT
jgi:hypothetical protein